MLPQHCSHLLLVPVGIVRIDNDISQLKYCLVNVAHIGSCIINDGLDNDRCINDCTPHVWLIIRCLSNGRCINVCLMIVFIIGTTYF